MESLKRKIKFTNGIVSGEDMRDLLEIIPELENSFTQRKSFDEYYFNGKYVEISLENLDYISNMFSIRMNYDEIVLEN